MKNAYREELKMDANDLLNYLETQVNQHGNILLNNKWKKLRFCRGKNEKGFRIGVIPTLKNLRRTYMDIDVKIKESENKIILEYKFKISTETMIIYNGFFTFIILQILVSGEEVLFKIVELVVVFLIYFLFKVFNNLFILKLNEKPNKELKKWFELKLKSARILKGLWYIKWFIRYIKRVKRSYIIC